MNQTNLHLLEGNKSRTSGGGCYVSKLFIAFSPKGFLYSHLFASRWASHSHTNCKTNYMTDSSNIRALLKIMNN